RTKVKTRIIATALKEFIDQSENVIVMGHRFGDLDCMGSAIGLARAIRKLGKNCFIAVDYKKNLATALIDRVIEAGHDDLFIHPVDALDIITPRTLLIITDTHNPDLLESPGIYEKCSNVVVIDHHRKMVNYIDRAVIFYHEPYSSSASEMVSELVQYLGDFKLGSLEAEALLAGIMLDTKNFVIKAGVRTFEAAAYLKGLGADTVSVRKLFSNSIDSYQRKTRIVSGAETYRNCAIAMGDFQCEDIRIVAPQAADELLGISNVDASFVLYRTGTTANITARSLGAINAQVVMEMLGGGGHQTMAATQLENTNLEKARQMLLEAIDKYLTQS
ncbi:MAG: DHH family phosphoesterase, partial [Massilioclostridium sp.]|nr:DHH family phosphoesterase [Massilioclostridium sp.]